MEANRPVVLSIAGFDPSAGAGLLADIKTFEQHKVYGLGISTAQTLQTEDEFFAIRWEDEKDILQSLEIMLSHYDVKTVKIGVIENINRLEKVVSFIYQKNKMAKIVIDTVIKSTSGFNFWNEEMNEELLFETFSKVFLITPNYNEAMQLLPSVNAKEAAQKLSVYCNVLLKGGHNNEETGVDYLYTKNEVIKLEATTTGVSSKHGSGCVLSAAITANLALGFDLTTSCINAKKHVEKFLLSNKTLLGYHHV
ncbi:MAG TPA: hydroxymethylpyrimidine/phosphomethylpyrimidine kinase [Chitinophagaceae bacterium]